MGEVLFWFFILNISRNDGYRLCFLLPRAPQGKAFKL